MRNLSRSIAALACAAALPGLAGAEDLTIISKTIANQGAPKTVTQYIAADRFRSSDGESDTIMEMGEGRFTVIDHKKKEYYAFTRDEMLASMQKLEQQMAGPGAAMMEKMMGGPGGEVTMQKGASRKVAGYDCTSYTFSLGENLRYEMCATQAVQLPPQLYDAMKGSYSMMGPMAKRLDKIFDAMKKVNGFPVAMSSTVNMMGSRINFTSEVTEIRKGAIPATAFQLPAGYKKKDAPFPK